MQWWKRRPEMLRDAVGAVPIVLVFLVAQQMYGDGGSVPRAVVIVVVITAALTIRRRWPVVTFAAAVLTVATAATGLELLVIAAYTLVAHAPRSRPIAVGLISTLALTAGFLQYWPSLAVEDVAGDLILIAAIALLPAFFGQAVRNARRATAELEARNAELVALREQAAQHAVEAERFRIARELHDVVAHHVSAMTVRARAGRHVAGRHPQAATDALGYIAEAGSEALTAMGRFVGTLRGEGVTAGPGDLGPQPGLDDIPELLESFRRTGLVVHQELGDPPEQATGGLGLNAYRIVQEALTNAIRHGAAERVWVRTWSTAGLLHIQVDDDGGGLRRDDCSAGHGLIGIAERAALHGGASTLGESPRGGCRLAATLGVGDASAAQVPAGQSPAVGPS